MNNGDDKLIEKIARLMQRDDSVDAPADSVKWAKHLFRARAAAAEPQQSVVKKILAVLQADLSGAKPAFGERSASSAAARQMLFEAGDVAIDLRILKSGKQFTLQGQILGEGFENCAVEIGDHSAHSNELGEFKIEGVAEGTYDLTLKSKDTEIVIENLQIS